MAYQSFPTEIKPNRGQGLDISHRHLSSQYGDGYELAEPAGINNKQRSISAPFSALSEAERDTLEAFLDARGSYEPFYWVLEGGTQILVLQESFSYQSTVGDVFDCSLQLKQTYRADS